MSRRFLFTVWPFAGHLLPMLSIGIALRERGHEVCFYSGESACETIEQAGFELFPFDRLSEEHVVQMLGAVDGAGRRGRPEGARMLNLLRNWLVETIPAQVTDLRGVLGSWHPDAIFTDMSLWGPMLVLWEAEQIPVALCSTIMGPQIPGPDAPALGYGLRPPRTRSGRLLSTALNRVAELCATPMRRRLDDVRAQHGLGPLGESVNRYTARLPLYIVSNVRELDYNRRDLPESVHYVGHCIWYPERAGSQQWLDAIPTGRPWVHVTESTMASGDPFLLRTAIAALAQEPLEVILTTGEERYESVLGDGALPANIHVAPWLSHGELLPRCAALVTLGGTSTVLAAAQAGVPMVLVPNNWDKPNNARRVTEVGAGIRLSARRLDEQTLRVAVREVLAEPSYREAAQQLAGALASAPGPARAAELLEQLTPTRDAGSAFPALPTDAGSVSASRLVLSHRGAR